MSGEDESMVYEYELTDSQTQFGCHGESALLGQAAYLQGATRCFGR